MRFRAIILSSGKTATGIRVPPEVLESLGSGKRPPVSVTINGYTYRSTVATVSGEFMVGVSAEVREAAGVAVPPDFAEALDRDADARRFFDGLSYSNKRRIVLPIEEARSDEVRQRRIAKAVSSLHEGRI